MDRYLLTTAPWLLAWGLAAASAWRSKPWWRSEDARETGTGTVLRNFYDRGRRKIVRACVGLTQSFPFQLRLENKLSHEALRSAGLAKTTRSERPGLVAPLFVASDSALLTAALSGDESPLEALNALLQPGCSVIAAQGRLWWESSEQQTEPTAEQVKALSRQLQALADWLRHFAGPGGDAERVLGSDKSERTLRGVNAATFLLVALGGSAAWARFLFDPALEVLEHAAVALAAVVAAALGVAAAYAVLRIHVRSHGYRLLIMKELFGLGLIGAALLAWPALDRWATSFNRLFALVQAHVKEEENDFFPKAQELIDEDESKQILTRYEAAKQSVKRLVQ